MYGSFVIVYKWLMGLVWIDLEGIDCVGLGVRVTYIINR